MSGCLQGTAQNQNDEATRNVLTLPMNIRAEMAMRAAYENLVIEHARQGWPIVVWREGKMVEVSPEELKVEAAKILAE